MKPGGKLCYTDKDSFIVYIKTEDTYVDIAKDVKQWQILLHCVIKHKLKFKDYKHFLEANQLENKINKLDIDKTDPESLKKSWRIYIRK